ncbi:MAG TPA: response regulator transcription factor [Acidisoma sp.]|jgi:DNA-binding NarL/FixJ family response regulator|uniref:response regulator transcription factor n=1 Tax=Acidisoma sp. TaxID=1872115 RepID=UPI002BCB23B4|nr:response regulator transcription factor [Acidisoma sp.]HTI01898.1 response regulator transcription factor [Acidisoma sp.]
MNQEAGLPRGLAVSASQLVNIDVPFEYIHQTLSVALVDDRKLSRDCIALTLKANFDSRIEVSSFATIEEVFALEAVSVDIVVLYIHEGCEAQVRSLLGRIKDAQFRLLVITDESAAKLSSFFRDALRGGVNGFISTSHTAAATLQSAIMFILNGGAFVPPELFLEHHPAATATYSRVDIADPLTKRQQEVFSKLKEGKPNKIIAFELGMSESTAKVHIRNIMHKLGATNRTQAVFLSRSGNGLAAP